MTLTLFNRAPRASCNGLGWNNAMVTGARTCRPLNEGHWDAVIDCCGYLPSEVQATSTLLLGRVQPLRVHFQHLGLREL